MAVNDNQKIFNQLYRSRYGNEEYYFEEIVKNAILKTITDDSIKAEIMASNKVNQLWNRYRREYTEDISNGIVPLFMILNDYDKKVQWIDNTKSHLNREIFLMRPELYKYIDSLNDREYEVLACVICKLLGADKILLTPKGNEGGVDFFARIPFSSKAHFLFGVKGPVRLVGQCKKYNSKDNVGHMKEFVTTMNNVYNHSFRLGEILPSWFKMERGNIIGWHISNYGHQAGALDVAKNYGILVSDSKQLIEILCTSKMIRRQKDPLMYIKKQMKEDNFI